MTMPRKRVLATCPGCGGEKLETSLLCRKCRGLTRRGENHPNWKAAAVCPDCGGEKDRSSIRCHGCYLKQIARFDDGKHVYAREWQQQFRRTPEGRRHVRAMNLKRFGLTPEEYDRIFAEQNGVCAACGQPETGKNQFGLLPLAVDHDHNTGNVRGLLCMRCNRALGLLGDSPDRVARLFKYRQRFEEVLP